MSQNFDYDLFVIGAGSGGVRAARWAASNYGVKVGTVELPFALISSKDRGGAGGTCVIRGCVPKKLMVIGSSFRQAFKEAEGFGWPNFSEEAIQNLSFKKFMDAKNKEVTRLNGVYNKILDNANVNKFEGSAHFVDKHTLCINQSNGQSKQITSKYIIVATGNYSTMIPIEGKDHTINSDQILCLQSVPKKLVIIGAGYIGIEFSNIYNNFGSEVDVLYRSELPLKQFDKDCQVQVAENMTKNGINLHPFSKISKIEKRGEENYIVHGISTKTDKPFSLLANVVLAAVGRKPRTEDLNLEKVGVNLQEKTGAVIVDHHLQTNIENIYALGDVTNRLQLTPMALNEGTAVANYIFGQKEGKQNAKNKKADHVKVEGEEGLYWESLGPSISDHRLVPTAIFSQPPMSTVGATEDEAIESFSGNIDIFIAKFNNMKTTLSGSQSKVLMKMLVHQQSDRVIGVHMVGDDAPELMQSVGVCLKAKATKRNFDETIGIHPTTAEELVTLRDKVRTVVGKGQLTPDNFFN